MSRTLRVVLVIAAVAFVIAAAVERHRIAGAFNRHILGIPDKPPVAVFVDKPLPPLNVSDLAGKPIALDPKTGRVSFVNVFATWCPPCKLEAPALAEFAGRWSGRGLDVVGIDEQEDAPAVRAFAQKFGIAYPLYIDHGHVTDGQMGVRLIPTTFVVDRAGTVRAIFKGPMTRETMEKLAAQALASSSGPPRAQSKPSPAAVP